MPRQLAKENENFHSNFHFFFQFIDEQFQFRSCHKFHFQLWNFFSAQFKFENEIKMIAGRQEGRKAGRQEGRKAGRQEGLSHF
jgi:hypothetical protein